MADGFTVIEVLDHAPEDVWIYLTDFANAPEWMTGIGDFSQITQGPLEIGTRLRFKARGKERETRVTATYTYSVTSGDDGCEVTLKAVCKATGPWKLVHPVIVLAMRKSDSSQLANLKLAMGRLAADHRHSQVK